MFKKSYHITFLISTICMLTLSGCGLLKRSRVTRHNGIPRTDFDLPIFIYPASTLKSKALVLLLSGDGGWVDFEDEISVQMAAAGINTIGFNSRDYFWERKTPRQTADDLAMLITKYGRQYRPEQIILCGYSFGADVVPFIYNRLPQHLKHRITAIGLLSPFATSDFKVHTSDLLNIASDNRQYKVKAEVDRVNRVPIYCFYGQDEEPRPLEGTPKTNFYLKLLPGSHSYDESGYKDIISTIINGPNQK